MRISKYNNNKNNIELKSLLDENISLNRVAGGNERKRTNYTWLKHDDNKRYSKINKLDKMEALADFRRDFVTMFLEVEARFDKWVKAIINRSSAVIL
ncbi:hypothetical protein RclHR1_08720007 [Rhizophagus clarus]|uniref:Uncharacterized protein n=1 Tax=Rhizophagus clarus TaxID=94130 RepID=A0A2Z6S234_9GLOM|nr:hypothetical protein RclHR1_08720007 [Rhizophagus clarus]